MRLWHFTTSSTALSLLGSVLIAYSVYAFSAAFLYGPLFIMGFLVAWVIPVALNPRVFRISVSDLVVFALPMTALVSTIWSAHPDLTLRGASQYLLTVAIASLAAQITGPRNFARGVFVGCMVVIVHSLIITYQIEPDIVRVSGLFGSPNQLGLIASLAILFGLVLVLGYEQSRNWRIATWVCVALSAYVLYWTESITSIVSLVAALIAVFLIKYMSSLSRNYRRLVMPWLVVAAAGAIGLLALFLPRINVFELVGRDDTMSGRTELWQVGLEVFGKQTALGSGYQAFWVLGNPEAERLWDAYLIDAKMGFHFHNFYIQVVIDLGIVGFIVFVIAMVSILYRVGVPLFVDRISRRTMIYAPLLVLFLARSTSEVDFFGPFSIGTILVFFVAFQSARSARESTKRSVAATHALTRDPFEKPFFRLPDFAALKKKSSSKSGMKRRSSSSSGSKIGSKGGSSRRSSSERSSANPSSSRQRSLGKDETVTRKDEAETRPVVPDQPDT